MARSNEPLIWSLFAGGGVVAALLIPVHILLLGLAIPLGWLEAPTQDKLLGLATHPIGKLYLFVLISLPLYHAAHRLIFTIIDLGFGKWRKFLQLGFYGGAIVGTAVCAIILVRL